MLSLSKTNVVLLSASRQTVIYHALMKSEYMDFDCDHVICKISKISASPDIAWAALRQFIGKSQKKLHIHHILAFMRFFFDGVPTKERQRHWKPEFNDDGKKQC